MKGLRIAFDLGGVLSKYPGTFRDLLAVLCGHREGVEVYVISDMHDREKVIDMMAENGFGFLNPGNVYSADYSAHGEECKAVLCRQLEIDILVDDFIGYVSSPGRPSVRLLVMPDPVLDYYAPEWKTDGSEGNFGRRRPSCA